MNKHKTYFIIVLIETIVLYAILYGYKYFNPNAIGDDHINLVVFSNIVISYLEFYLLDFFTSKL